MSTQHKQWEDTCSTLNKQQIIIREQNRQNCLRQQIEEKQKLELYHQFFQNKSYDSFHKQKIIEELGTNFFVIYNETKFNKSFKINIFNFTPNYQVIQCEVKFGPFTQHVLILNTNKKSLTHQLGSISSTFAAIFSYQYKQHNIIIKCFAFEEDNFSEIFQNVLKEYCLLKIAVGLRVGPAISSINGFDLIIHEKCIQFAMQRCQKIAKLSKSHEIFLTQKLLRLHTFQFVHVDIKPANICYSNTFKQPVFIDYGLSMVIAETVAERTFTNFAGSMSYCCPQMLALYNHPANFVNLYLNDVHCLQKTFKQIFQENKEYNNKFKNISEQLDDGSEQLKNGDALSIKMLQNIFNQFLKFRIKYIIYYSRQVPMDQRSRQIINKNSEQLLNYIKLLPYSISLQRTCLKILKQKMEFKWQANHNISYQQKKETDLFQIIGTAQNNFNNDHIDSIFTNRFQKLSKGLIIKKNNQNITELFVQNNLKQLLIKQELISNVTVNTYYSSVIRFINLKSSLSTLDQKKKVCEIMIKNCNLDMTGVSSYFVEMQICLRFMLKYYLQIDCSEQVEQLPTIINNLIILEVMSLQQIHKLFEQILELKIQIIEHAKLLFRCLMIKDWIISRVVSKYKCTKIKQWLTNKILQKLANLSDSGVQRCEIIQIIIKLIGFDCGKISQKDCHFYIIQLYNRHKYYQYQFFVIQLLIYYNAVKMKYSYFNSKQLQILKCIQKLNIYERIVHKNGQNFEYYHFRIIKQLTSLNNSKLLHNLYFKFTSCLQSQELMNKYQFCFIIKQIQYYNKDMNNSNIQKLLLNKNDSFFINYNFVNMVNTLCSSIQNKQIFQNHQTIITLRQIFTIQKLKELSIQDESMQNDNYFQTLYIRIMIYTNLYQPNSRNSQSILFLIQKIRQIWNKIQCQDCKINSQIFVVLIQGSIFQYLNQPEQALLKYQQFIYKIKSKPTKKTIIFQFLSKMLRIATYHPQLQSKYQIQALFYQHLQSQNYYFSLLQSGDGRYIFLIISQFLVMKQNNIKAYIQLHYKLIQYLFHCPSKQFVSNYVLYTIRFFRKYLKQSQTISEQAKSDTFRNNTNNIIQDYIVLFYSICLIYQKQQNSNSYKLLKIICQHLHFITITAKNILLGNIYHYLIYSYCKRLLNKCQNTKYRMKRQFQFYFKYYVKYNICQFNFRQFVFRLAQKLGNFKLKGLKQNGVIKKLKIYFGNVVTSEPLSQRNDIYHSYPLQKTDFNYKKERQKDSQNLS